jgi:hypothetical protein
MSILNIKIFIFSNENPQTVKNIFSGKSNSGLVSGTVNVVPIIENEKFDLDYWLTYNSLRNSTDTDYVIICKDAVVSTMNSSDIFDILENVINRNDTDPNNSFDLFYLGKWMDRCDQFTNQIDIGDTGMKIVNTISPNGIMCIMFSPQGRKKFLEIYDIEKTPILTQTLTNKQTLGHYLHHRIGLKTNYLNDNDIPISQQKFYAITSSPSIIDFDISKRKSDSEFIKTVECRNTQQEVKNTETQSSMTFFWFIVIVLIIIFVVWICYKYSSSYKIEKVVEKIQ